MSSTVQVSGTASPTVSQSQSSTPSQSTFTQGNASSNLYLFTFLATLLLLLIISCSIVLRSFILRRRYRRRLDAAIAQGLIPAPREPGSRRKRLGTKPVLHEAYLSDPSKFGGKTLDAWEEIAPISAQPVKHRRRHKGRSGQTLSSRSAPPTNAAAELIDLFYNGSPRRNIRSLFRGRGSRITSSSSETPSSGPNPSSPPHSPSDPHSPLYQSQNDYFAYPPSSPQSPEKAGMAPSSAVTILPKPQTLQVSVMIAMPSQMSWPTGAEVEEDLPELVMGMTRLAHNPHMPPPPPKPETSNQSLPERDTAEAS